MHPAVLFTIFSSAIVFGGFLFSTQDVQAQYGSACSEYGVMAYESGGYCKCMSGYVMGTDFLGNKSCVSGTSHCQDKYGYNARYDSLSGSCECGYGYVMSKNMFGDLQCISDDQACKDQYGINARASYGGKCECRSGYGFQEQYGGTQCVSFDSICYDRLGANSDYDSLSDSCTCDSGYELTQKSYSSGLECKSCFAKYGLHSSWNYLSDECECDDGYTLDDDGQCVEKHNSAYFTLLDISEDGDELLVQSQYDYQNYIIEFGIGCWDYAIESYEGGSLVINMGTDFSVDMFDTLVLPNHDQNCSIMGVDWTSDDSFPEPEEDDAYYYVPPIQTYTPPATLEQAPEPEVAFKPQSETAEAIPAIAEEVNAETSEVATNTIVFEEDVAKAMTSDNAEVEESKPETNTEPTEGFFKKIINFFKGWF